MLSKPLAPLAGRPVALHLLEHLGQIDLDAIAINVHHGADLIERVLGRGPVYLHEEWPRGTAGALAGAKQFLRGDDFLVASADGVHAIDLGALVARHREAGAAATITVKRISRPETCAIVELGGDGLVRRFVEKPPPGAVFTDLASIGVYCFAPGVLELIPGDRPFDIAGELIPLLLERGMPVAAYATDAWWSDIGTPGELLEANLAAARGELDLKHAPEVATTAGVHVYVGSAVAADALVQAPALVGPDATVGSGATVRGALVLPGAEVPAGAFVSGRIHGDGEGVVRSWLARG